MATRRRRGRQGPGNARLQPEPDEGSGLAHWERLEQEHVNLQALLKWLIERGDAERGLELAYRLQEHWFENHHTGEGRTLFAALLANPAASARTDARARYLDLAGAFVLSQNDFAEARSLKKEGVAICRQLEDDAALGRSLVHLGHVELYAGDFSAAQKLYQEALRIFVGLDDQRWTAFAVGGLSNVALEQADYVMAGRLVHESLQRYRELGFEWELALTVGNAAGVAAGLGQPERAVRLAGASAAHRERISVSLPPMFKERFERMIGPARKVLDETSQTLAWEEGAAMTLEQAVKYALDSASIPS